MAKSKSVIGGFQKIVKRKSYDFEEERKDKKDRLKSVRRSRGANRSMSAPYGQPTENSTSQDDYDDYENEY